MSLIKIRRLDFEYTIIIDDIIHIINDEMDKLPYELLVEVLSYLTAADLANVGRVCRRLNVASKDNSLWKVHCINDNIISEDNNYYRSYIREMRDTFYTLRQYNAVILGYYPSLGLAKKCLCYYLADNICDLDYVEHVAGDNSHKLREYLRQRGIHDDLAKSYIQGYVTFKNARNKDHADIHYGEYKIVRDFLISAIPEYYDIDNKCGKGDIYINIFSIIKCKLSRTCEHIDP